MTFYNHPLLSLLILLMNKDNRICIYSLILVVNPINHGVVFTDHGVVYKDHAVVCRIEVDPI